MTYTYNYPYTSTSITHYFKVPLEITDDVIDQLREMVAILPPKGKYIAVEIDVDEWHPAPVPVQFDSKESCKEACDFHNKWICDLADWDYEFVTEVINRSPLSNS